MHLCTTILIKHIFLSKSLASEIKPSKKINMDDEDARIQVDKMIPDFEAQFILQVHLLKPVLKKLSRRRRLECMAAHQLHNLILRPNLRDDMLGQQGLKCHGFEPSCDLFEMTIKANVGEDHCTFESKEWGQLLSRMKENAVVSLWLYYESDASNPGILFRIDGYAKEGEPLPAIPTFPKKDDEHNVADDRSGRRHSRS